MWLGGVASRLVQVLIILRVGVWQLESSLWSSFEALCGLDPDVQASDFFGPSLPPATPNATRGTQTHLIHAHTYR